VPAFVCPACRQQRFEDLPRTAADALRRTQQRRLLHAYHVFLNARVRDLPRAAQAVLRYAAPSRWEWGYAHEARAGEPWLRVAVFPTQSRSLEYLAAAFVMFHIPPERVADGLSSPPLDLPPCLHRACEFYGSSLSVRLFGARHGEWETYCDECGSRFLGGRITLSFFPHHGNPRLSDRAVRVAAARVARYRQALSEACVRDPWGDRTVLELFRDAGIPPWPNLLARRLGLAQLIRNHRANVPRRGYPRVRYVDFLGGAGHPTRWRHTGMGTL
jgi:hypothetical protein